MSGEPIWRRYLRLVRPDPVSDAEDEIGLHLELLEQELLREGWAPAEARREARRRFGDPGRIRRDIADADHTMSRHRRRSEIIEELASDVRYALRTLRRQPGFSLAVVATLALGIGATTAMFSVVDAALLRSLPFRRAGQLVSLSQIHVPFAFDGTAVGPETTPDFRTLGRMADVFERYASYARGGVNLSGDGTPERLRVGVVTTDFFATLGMSPARGRVFAPLEGVPNGPSVVVLSDRLWRRRYDGKPMLGRSVVLNDRSCTVVGIMPAGFNFPENSDLWIPMSVPNTIATFEMFRGFIPETTIGRLRDGVSAAAAAERLRETWRRTPRGRDNAEALQYPLVPFQVQLLGSRDADKPLLMLLGATALLLLIACANAASLLIARATNREPEIAMRRCLGASRGRIVRQVLIESLLLSLAGAATGLGVALSATGTLRALMPPSIADVAPVAIDGRVLVFALVIATLVGLGFGLWPAMGLSRADGSTLVRSGAGAVGRGAGRIRRALVTLELGIALTLVAGAVLMARSFQAMMTTDLGFHTEHVGTLEISFGERGLEPAARLAVIDGAVDRLATTPGVTAAGVTNNLPLVPGSFAISVQAEATTVAPSERPMATLLYASTGYFHALGIPLLEGRLIGPEDADTSRHVVVISQALARTLFPGQHAIGKRMLDIMRLPRGQHAGGAKFDPDAFRTVVGVVGDVHHREIEEVDRWPQMFYPIAELAPPNVALVARGQLPPPALLAAMRTAMNEADPDLPVYNLRMMDDVVDTMRAPRRLNTTLMLAFGALALLLAAVGVYGVVAYGVARRMREFGIRAALGARAGHLLRLAAAESAWVAVIGIAIGVAGSYAFAHAIRALLYGVAPTDPLTFVLAAAALAVLVLLASLVPARRAARLNPMDVIRAE